MPVGACAAINAVGGGGAAVTGARHVGAAARCGGALPLGAALPWRFSIRARALHLPAPSRRRRVRHRAGLRVDSVRRRDDVGGRGQDARRWHSARRPHGPHALLLRSAHRRLDHGLRGHRRRALPVARAAAIGAAPRDVCGVLRRAHGRVRVRRRRVLRRRVRPRRPRLCGGVRPDDPRIGNGGDRGWVPPGLYALLAPPRRLRDADAGSSSDEHARRPRSQHFPRLVPLTAAPVGTFDPGSSRHRVGSVVLRRRRRGGAGFARRRGAVEVGPAPRRIYRASVVGADSVGI
mmetsp:Transcript_5674/g.20522  ORF Transcript_5674/g.20522 Transcript_5674/m.20522 type:complete len:291 (+) Transcript_5674:486-1358(+)